MGFEDKIKELKEKIVWKSTEDDADFSAWEESDYSDDDYGLIELDGFAEQPEWADKTWKQAFFDTAIGSDWVSSEFKWRSADDWTTNKISYYKKYGSDFPDEMQLMIDYQLSVVLEKEEYIGFPAGLLRRDKEDFDTSATPLVNASFDINRTNPDVQVVTLKASSGGRSASYSFPGTDKIVNQEVYDYFKDQEDDGVPTGKNNGIKLNELENEVGGYTRAGEIPKITNIESISIVNQIEETKLMDKIDDMLQPLHAAFDKARGIDRGWATRVEETLSFSGINAIQWHYYLYIRDLREKRFIYHRRLKRFESLADLGEDLMAKGVDAAVGASTIFSDTEGLYDVFGTDATEESEENIDVAARQKFFEQCALLSRLGPLSSDYKGFLKKKLFGSRLYLVEDTDVDTSANMNKLLLPAGEKIDTFLEITPDVAAMLVPKIKLFLVRNIKGKLQKKQFVFPTSTPANIEKVFAGGGIIKGTDFGIKSFSFSFEGTNPAEARKDIKASLTLFFQDFEDFTKDRGDDPKFVDLIMFDRNKETPTGFGASIKNQYSPAHYRILAEVGWQMPAGNKLRSEINARHGKDGYDKLKKAILKTNRGFYLNMTEHDMNFSDSGTFEVTAHYQAYLESALKGPEFDALATPDIIARRIERERQFQKLVESKTCNAEGLRQIMRAFEAEDVELIKDSYQSIISRLLCDNKVFTATIAAEDLNYFKKYGFFKGACKFPTNSLSAPKDNVGVGAAQEEAATSVEKKTINYFFLGDLIHTILDPVFDDKNTFNKNLPNTKFILFPFQTQGIDGEAINLNLGFIPISVDYFIEWFTANVIAVDRRTFPIMLFIRNLANKLITEILSESCRYKPLENKITFNTANILAMATNAGDPLSGMTEKGTKFLNIKDKHSAGDLPLQTDAGKDVDMDKYWNYIIIYPVYSVQNHAGTGDYTEDLKRGVYHFDIGSDRGLVKKMKFSKFDMAYTREARFFQQGAQGLAQLQAVYKASIDMIGNTLYYPGMEIFINPRGLGGGLGDPTSPLSIANTLGFGGYHMITRVESRIQANSFNTTLEAIFTYAGDGGDPSLNVTAIEKTEPENIEESSAVPERCRASINAAEKNVLNLYDEDSTGYTDLTSIIRSERIAKAAAAEAVKDPE